MQAPVRGIRPAEGTHRHVTAEPCRRFPLRALGPCHPDRNSRLCRSVAERMEMVRRPAGWAYGGVL